MSKSNILEYLSKSSKNHLLSELIALEETYLKVYSNKWNSNFICTFSNPQITIFDSSAQIIDLKYYSWVEKNFSLSVNNIQSTFRFKKIFHCHDSFLDLDYSSLFQNPKFIQLLEAKSGSSLIPPMLQDYFLL